MWADLKKTFTRVSVHQTAEDELYEAEKALLTAQTKLEFAQADVTAQAARVERLRKFVNLNQPKDDKWTSKP